MIDAMIEKSRELAETRARSFKLRIRMQNAAKGQNPRIFVISSIQKCGQDNQILGLGQGDAFWATRVPGFPLPAPEESPFLFGGPAAYSSHFHGKVMAVITFDSDEPDSVVQESISVLSENENLRVPHIIGLQLDSVSGHYRSVGQGKLMDRAVAGVLTRQYSEPLEIDEGVLVVLCSDSRLLPPMTSKGAPMTIRTLGGFIPSYDESLPETMNLDDFLTRWLEQDSSEKRIVAMAHGNPDADAAACGAAKASLDSSEIADSFLRSIVEQIGDDAMRADSSHETTAHSRAIAIAKATRRNLGTYPAISAITKKRILLSEVVQLAYMDTVTGILTPY